MIEDSRISAAGSIRNSPMCAMSSKLKFARPPKRSLPRRCAPLRKNSPSLRRKSNRALDSGRLNRVTFSNRISCARWIRQLVPCVAAIAAFATGCSQQHIRATPPRRLRQPRRLNPSCSSEIHAPTACGGSRQRYLVGKRFGRFAIGAAGSWTASYDPGCLCRAGRRVLVWSPISRPPRGDGKITT